MKKSNYFIVVFCLLVLGFTSCVIREPEDKTTLTKGGYQLFTRFEADISEQTRLFDKVLFLDKYINTPDSLKARFHNEYFDIYTLRFKQNICNFVNLSKDTVYKVITDSHSIHATGAEWLIKSSDQTYLKVTCLQKNKWKLSVFKTYMTYSYSLNESNLELTCTDTIAPALYQNANFEITGNAKLIEDNYSYSVVFDYVIGEPLKHNNTSVLFKDGLVTITANDSVHNRTATTEARYINAISPSVEIKFNGVTSTYKNNIYSFDYDY